MVDSVFEMPNWKTLVVDDQQVIRDAVRCLATQYIGESDECGDGDEAVDKYAQAFESGKPYDLILLDLEMPRMDGPETVEAIRNYEDHAHVVEENRVRVVLVTGYPDENQVKEWFTDKHDAYIVKPITKQKLMDTVTELRH
ncbi:MAG: response regulator [Candidatus Hydrogenedentota bacterium]